MSIHADDEFSLRLAFESELDDVMPREGLATVVIERYRKGRRRRIAGAVGLVVAFAGIGVPLGLTSSGGGSSARSSPIVLRLASYALKLPAMYHLAGAYTPACAATTEAALAAVPAPRAASQAESTAQAQTTAPPSADVTAAASSSACVVMLLLPPATAAGGDPAIPPDASEVNVGRYHAWLLADAGGQDQLVIEGAAGSRAQAQDLIIGASSLSRTELIALVGASLSTR